MAKVGLKYVVGATLDVENGSYSEGKVVAKAISADISVNVEDSVLWADDTAAERVKEFKDGTITLGVDDLALEVQSWILGHTYKPAAEGDVEEMVSKDGDQAPYLGIGVYAPRLKDGKKTFRAIWLSKVKFAEPQDTMNTKGDNTSFGTPNLSGSIDRLDDGTWKIDSEHTTEESAKNWLNTKAGITAQ